MESRIYSRGKYDIAPTLPRIPTTNYNPYASQQNTDPSAYYTQALGFLPIDTRYMVNPTNSLAYNSMADVLFNQAAHRERWANSSTPWMDDWWATPLRLVADTGLLIKDTVVDPIVQGAIDDGFSGFLRGSSTALMNSLVNLGNTLDIVSNPIKGLFLEGGAGFVKGLVGDSNGRKQYDYINYINTGNGVGNFLLSLGLEIISDPINWFTFGTKGAISAGADAAVTPITKTVKETIEGAIKTGSKTVNDVLPKLKNVTPYFTDATAESFLKQMADGSGNIIKTAIDPTIDAFGKGLKKAIQNAANKGGNEAALRSLATDLTSGKITRMKAGMFDVNPIKLSPAAQMGVSDYLHYASTNLPDLFKTGKLGVGLKVRNAANTVQKGLFNVAGLTGLDYFVGGNKIINRVAANLKVNHAKNSTTILRDVTAIDKELRIDVDSLDLKDFPGLEEVKLKALAGTDHSGIATKLNDLKDKFTAKIIEARRTQTLTEKTYQQIRDEILSEIDDVIKAGTKDISNLKNLDEYLNFFTELRAVSKTEVEALDNIIDQITAYKNLFTAKVDKNLFSRVNQTFYYYERALDQVFTETQMDNIAKAAEPATDVYSKIKSVKKAEQEMFNTMQEQAQRVAVRDEQIANSIKYITEQHDKITNSVKPITNAYFKQAPDSSAIATFTKDYEAYRDAYEAYFDMVHLGNANSNIQKAQTDLINAYNKLVESYEINAYTVVKQAQQADVGEAAKATLSDVQAFIKSLQAQHIDEVDELINLRHYAEAGLISYTLMTQQTKYLTDLIGLTLDGSRAATNSGLGYLLDAYQIDGPLYKLLYDVSVSKKTIKGQTFTAIKNMLAKQSYFKATCEELSAMCTRAGLDVGHRQGLIDSLVTELQRGDLNSSINFHSMAERMLKSSELYLANHLVDKSFKLTGNMRTIFIGQLEQCLKTNLSYYVTKYANTKLFSAADINTLGGFRKYLKQDPNTKQLTKYIDQIQKGWYSPPDFNATKYFTVSKINPKEYTKAMAAYMDNLKAQGLLNVTDTANIQQFLNKGVAFDTVQLNFKTAVSKEFANVFSLKKMPSSIVSRQVAEEITLHARGILNKRIILTDVMVERFLPDAREIIKVLQDDAALIKLGVDPSNNLCTYAKWLYDNTDDATVVATALYYADKVPGLEPLLKQDMPTILRLREIDVDTGLPKMIFEDDYYDYKNFIKIAQSDNPFKIIKAYNTEHNIYNIHEAAIHRMQADNVALFKKVEELLIKESGGSIKTRKFLERSIYKYTDYLDEHAIKDILKPSNGKNRVQNFIDEAKLRAGRVYFETRDAIDLSDFAKTDGVITKSIELFDETTGKSLGYGHVICLTKKVYNKANDIACGIKTVDAVPNVSSEMMKLIKENRYHNGLYVKNIGWSHGDILTKQHIRSFDDMLETKFGINADELVDLNTLTSQKYFETLRANNMIIGGRDVFNRVLGTTDLTYTADPFKLTFYNTRGAVTAKQTRLAAYLNLCFTKENRIDSWMFNKLSNTELYKLAKQHKDEFGFYYLEKSHVTKDAKPIFFSDRTESGYVMREIPIINEKSVQVARDIQAYCIPRAQAAQMMQAINTFQLPPLAKGAQFVSTIYKLAYLGSVGVVIRNCIDSNYKTRWALDGTVALPDQIKHLFSTMKLINKYEDIGKLYSSVTQDYFKTNLDYELFYKTIKNLNEPDIVAKIVSEYSDDMSKMVTRKVDNILKQFSNNMDDLAKLESKLIDPDMFSIMDSFIRFGPSAGLSKSITQNFLSRSDDAVTSKIINWITEKSPARYVYGMNDMVEQSARLSMFLQDVSRGSTVGDAINNILKTHFDYSDKTLGMLYAEIIFPFMNFSHKNLNYWMEAIYKNPAMVGELENIFRTVLDYQSLFEEDQEAYSAYDYTFDWHEHVTSFKANAPWTQINAARLYHILNGNIVIDTGKDVVHDNGYGAKTNDLYRVFKLSPSVLDAAKMLYNPLNTYNERMLPPYELLRDVMLDALNGKIPLSDLNTYSLVSMLPYLDVISQRVGVESIDNSGIHLKHNNIFERTKDVGLDQLLLSSVFSSIYSPQKDKVYYYDSDYNILGGLKTNYYAKKNYSNPYNSKYPTYTLTRMAQNKKPKDIYAKSKTNKIYNQQYNNFIRGLSYRSLEYRLKDYYHYY